ncbi:MAG TPA: ATP-dependent protease subunit HslV [Thermomicrobiales bacterium]|jgi:ATP-dependent HslUV protease subunit HslV
MPPPALRPHATTILAVKRDGKVALAGDGQVTLGDVVVKHGARKVRRLHDGQVLAGFAGAAADALTLIDRFESQLDTWRGNLRKAAVETAKDWRTDRATRHLEAELIIADNDTLLLLSGDGDVLEPDDGAIAIGAGGTFAYAAAKALLEHTEMDARAIVEAAMRITARICIYTNDTLLIEALDAPADESPAGDEAAGKDDTSAGVA